ncbi:hypothetical protein ABZP36_023679 [Zizania latifolia]
MVLSTSPRRCGPWSDLPSDILGLSMSRITSHADRVRVRAVCRSWLAGARQEQRRRGLPAPSPWIAFRDGTLLDLADGRHELHQAPVPAGATCYGAVDGLLLLTHGAGRRSLVNPLSGSPATPLPELCPASFRPHFFDNDGMDKVIVISLPSLAQGSSPSPPEQLVAGLYGGSVIKISSLKPPPREVGGSPSPAAKEWNPRDGKKGVVVDIAQFQGKLYALNKQEGLHVLELPDHGGFLQAQTTTLSGTNCIADDPDAHGYHNEDWLAVYSDRQIVRRYLVASGDRLLMVRRWIYMPPMLLSDSDETVCERTLRMEVFAADLGDRRWTKVVGDGLNGQALFVSKQCSRSLPAGGGAREGCIYFLHEHLRGNDVEEPLGDSGVYDMSGSGTITPLLGPESTPAPLLCHSQRVPRVFYPGHCGGARRSRCFYLLRDGVKQDGGPPLHFEPVVLLMGNKRRPFPTWFFPEYV